MVLVFAHALFIEFFLRKLRKKHVTTFTDTEDGDEIRKLFKSNDQWLSKNKGSIYQYADAFDDEKLLKLLSIVQ